MRLQNKSGIILLIALWTVVILTMLAAGLGRRVSIELAMTKNALGKLRSKYIALGGLNYAMSLMSVKEAENEPFSIDSKYHCGFTLREDQRPEDLFRGIKIKNGFFDIGFYGDAFGFEDEESRININGLNANNYEILSQLILELGFDAEAADTIAASAVDWIDGDDEMVSGAHGAENNYYISRPEGYPCKNGYFDSINELALVRGMTSEIFTKLKPYITVFPKEGSLLVNLNTASEEVLLAYAKNYAGDKTNTTVEDARRLVEKIVSYRRGDDGMWPSSDDRLLQVNEMVLNASERVIFMALTQHQTPKSNFIRVTVRGVDENTQTASVIEAVINRMDLSVLYWHRT
ncbi:MAG: general secretion pathway protein GspK [Candidatus Omnitrophica bacterium]|nr:general secretion pathway protein GspK [Candidatus Omnitrophota bacterium]